MPDESRDQESRSLAKTEFWHVPRRRNRSLAGGGNSGESRYEEIERGDEDGILANSATKRWPSSAELAGEAIEAAAPAEGVAVLVGDVAEALVGEHEVGAGALGAELDGHLGLSGAGGGGFPGPGEAQGAGWLDLAIVPGDEAGLGPAGEQHADAVRAADVGISLADGGAEVVGRSIPIAHLAGVDPGGEDAGGRGGD